MVFCSVLAYDLKDPRRELANRCLGSLFQQMTNDDAFLKIEAIGHDWEDCLISKVKIVQAALKIASDFACLVDTDIFFMKGWISALKEFLKSFSSIEPIVAALPEWTDDGTYNFNDKSVITQLIDWGGLPVQQPRFYLNAGIVIVSVGAKGFVKEWMEWTLRAKGLHEQSALCYLLHHKSEVKVVFLPERLHYIPPLLPDLEVTIPSWALAVHALSSVRSWLWERLANGEFEIVSPEVAEGDRLRAKRRFEEALSYYHKALVSGQSLPQAYKGIGATYFSMGQIEEAITACQQALSLKPDYPEALYLLGDCYKEQENYEMAFECYRRALRLNPRDIRGKAKIATLLRHLLRVSGRGKMLRF